MSNGTRATLVSVAALAAAGALARRGRRGSPAEGAALPRSATGAQSRPQYQVTRAGFPWPEGTTLYHGTAAMGAIRRQGFKTRKQHGVQAAGGRHQWSVSFTLLPQRAASIALGLETLALGARRDMSLVNLLDKLLDEIPGAFPDFLTSGNDLQSVIDFNDSADEQIEKARRVFAHMDAIDGCYARVHFVRGQQPRLPKGTKVWGEGSYTHEGKENVTLTVTGPVRGLTKLGSDCSLSVPGMFHQTYRFGIRAGSRQEECFDPIFFGSPSSFDWIAKTPLASVGMIEATVGIPRICAGPDGAVMLGYLKPEDVYRRVDRQDGSHGWSATHLSERVGALFSRCTTVMEPKPEGESWGADRWQQQKASPMFDSWNPERTYGRMGDAVFVQKGQRTPQQTMEFTTHEQEIRVYDPSRIEPGRFVGMRELRLRYGLGDRITFPWLDERHSDVRVWPPGVQRAQRRQQDRYDWPR